MTPDRKGKNDGKGKDRWWRKSDADLVRDRIDDIRRWKESSRPEVDEGDRSELIREASKRDPRIRNLLDMVPVRRSDVIRDGDFLRVPIYRTDRGRRIATALGLKTERGIRFDDYGWAVWDLSNGRRDIRRIGRELKKTFGGDVDPLYPRLSKFYAYLQNLKLIRIEEKRGSREDRR